MSSNSSISISLTITSLTPLSGTAFNAIPLVPTEQWLLGDAIGNTLIRRKNHGVVYLLATESGFEIEKVLIDSLDRIEPFKSIVAKMAADANLECELSCVAYSDQAPDCNLSSTTIKRMCETGLAFDLDMIVCSTVDE